LWRAAVDELDAEDAFDFALAIWGVDRRASTVERLR
jgi:hypothetical protein